MPLASCASSILLQSCRGKEGLGRAELRAGVGFPPSTADHRLRRGAPTFRTFLMPLMVEVSKECTLRSSLM